jgi:hypothetical protein
MYQITFACRWLPAPDGPLAQADPAKPLAQVRWQILVDQVRRVGIGVLGLGAVGMIGSTGGRGSSLPISLDLCRCS